MIKIYGSDICDDCILCRRAFDENEIVYEFVDINKDLKLMKEFLKYRDSDPVFEACKAAENIGIPAIILENGGITLDWEKYLKERKKEFKKIYITDRQKHDHRPITKKEISDALTNLGLNAEDAVMVHASLSNIGYVCGGAQTIIEALIETVGNEGTVMMPAQSWKNLDPEVGVHGDVPKEYWQIIRENWPAFDKEITPTNTMGAVAEMFRRWKGTVRSDHPARSVAAWGKYAKYLTKDHDLSDIFGKNSPVGRLYELDGKVLLIGVGYDKNTSIHLADVCANYAGKHNCVEHSAVIENGKRVWKEYETLFVDGEDFADIGAAFENNYDIKKVGLGNCELRLMSQRSLVDFAIDWIEKNRR